MNPAQQARARVRLAWSFEKTTANEFVAWIGRVYGRAAELVEAGRLTDAVAVPATLEPDLRRRLVSRLVALGQETARLAVGHLLAQKADRPADDEVAAYLRRYGARRVAGIRKTTQRVIRRTIANGRRDGLTVDEIAAALRKATRSKAVRARARMIAQTELHQASERAAIIAAKKSGLRLVKTWASMEDERVRPAHARADGQTVAIDKPFLVGGERLQFPGDPAGSASNVINCRCTAVYSTAPLGLGLPRQWRPNRRPAMAEPA